MYILADFRCNFGFFWLYFDCLQLLTSPRLLKRRLNWSLWLYLIVDFALCCPISYRRRYTFWKFENSWNFDIFERTKSKNGSKYVENDSKYFDNAIGTYSDTSGIIYKVLKLHNQVVLMFNLWYAWILGILALRN